MATKKQDDFDAEKLIKASADHEKTLADLTSMVKRLDQRVGDSSSLAKSFKEAFDTDKKMDSVLTKLLCDLILNNDLLRDSVKNAVKKVDREWWGKSWKSAISAIGAVLLVVLGAFLQAWFGSPHK